MMFPDFGPFYLPAAILVLIFYIFNGFPTIRKIYIALLNRMFKSINPNGQLDDDDCSLIQRDVILSDSGLHIYPDLMEGDDCIMDLRMPTYFIKAGIEAIIEDEVTQRFSAQMLGSWNLLKRNNTGLEWNVKMRILWSIGFFLRYCVLLPYRFIIGVLAIGFLVVMNFLISLVPNMKLRRWLNRYNMILSFRMFVRAFSANITFHQKENRPKPDGICVANHTSPLDAIVLGSDQSYAMVGQSQGGFMGFMEKVFARNEAHIWFERGEIRDRHLVAQRMRDHVKNPNTLPILVFPEGTCINNTSVMMFKKGSFELKCPIYPVAIKYDARYADCFWNSRSANLVTHFLTIMTSWALKADVWYLPPMQQSTNETSIDFANRVKREIASKAHLIDLTWDGGLKRDKPKVEMLHTQQERFSKLLKKGL